MSYSAKPAVYSDRHIKHINAQFGQIVELLFIEPGGT